MNVFIDGWMKGKLEKGGVLEMRYNIGFDKSKILE